MVVVVAPKHLGSIEAIRKEFHVGRATVKKWIVEGAPIASEFSKPDKKGKTRLLQASAEYVTLQSWRVSQSRQNAA